MRGHDCDLDAFASKHDLTGPTVWRVELATDAVDLARRVAGYASPLAVGREVVSHAFVATLDRDGNVLDVLVYPSPIGGQMPHDLAVRPDGGVHVTGYSFWVFGEREHESPRGIGSDAFLTLHTRDGEVRWIKVFGGQRGYEGFGVAVDGQGLAVVVGAGRGDTGEETQRSRTRSSPSTTLAGDASGWACSAAPRTTPPTTWSSAPTTPSTCTACSAGGPRTARTASRSSPPTPPTADSSG